MMIDKWYFYFHSKQLKYNLGIVILKVNLEVYYLNCLWGSHTSLDQVSF